MVSSVPHRPLTKREAFSPYKDGLPKVFRRVARRGTTWGLPRNFDGYSASAQHELAIAGAATKCFLSVGGNLDGAYIAKFAHKNGAIETYTELLNNQLGGLLQFDMAHSGIAKLDGVLHFLSRSFRTSPDELLIHGSLMVEQLGLARADEIEKIKTVYQQQGIYDIEFVEQVIREFCGPAFDEVFEKFIEMLVFDALIGSMDRHPRNWGVLRTAKPPSRFRFAPIYDSARALLWDLSDDRINIFQDNEAELLRYIGKATPRIGLPATAAGGRKCSHFDLIDYLLMHHKALTLNALEKIPRNVADLAAYLLGQWPFTKVFKPARKRSIIRVIQIRSQKLFTLAQERRGHGSEIVGFTGGIQNPAADACHVLR
jgi:hypothetical protein